MQRGLQECWRSAQRWRTLISAAILVSEQLARRLAGVLGQCRELVHLNLSGNNICAVGKERLRASWRGQALGLFL
jgi:hypothetical protein